MFKSAIVEPDSLPPGPPDVILQETSWCPSVRSLRGIRTGCVAGMAPTGKKTGSLKKCPPSKLPGSSRKTSRTSGLNGFVGAGTQVVVGIRTSRNAWSALSRYISPPYLMGSTRPSINGGSNEIGIGSALGAFLSNLLFLRFIYFTHDLTSTFVNFMSAPRLRSKRSLLFRLNTSSVATAQQPVATPTLKRLNYHHKIRYLPAYKLFRIPRKPDQF